MYTKPTESKLRAAGWFPGRAIDITRYQEIMARANMPVYDCALRFLSEFGGLNISMIENTPPRGQESFSIDVDDWLFDYDEVDRNYYNSLAGEVLTNIGSVYTAWYLVMCEHGSMMTAGDGMMYLLGNNTEEIIEALAQGNGWMELSAPLPCAQKQ